MTAQSGSITKVTTAIALLVAAVIAVAIPVVYFAVACENLAGKIEAETEINGRLMTQLVHDNPELWRYETFRLDELLSRRPSVGPPEIRRLVDMSGNVVVANGPRLKPPFLTRRSVIMAFGTPVAVMEISASYHTIVVKSALMALLGLLAGLAFYATMRILPLKAVRRSEEALREANDFLSNIMQNSTNGIFVLNPDLTVIMANRRGAELFRCEESRMPGCSFAGLLPDTPSWREGEALRKLSQGEIDTAYFEAEICSGSSTTFISCGAAPVLRDGSVHSIVISAEDITERKKAEKDILQMAYFDELTGLPNRTLFSERVERALASARRSTGKAAVMLVDLDNFKRINDTLGHRIGDQVLKTIADRLTHCLRSSDPLGRPGSAEWTETVARFGGDEFTVVLSMIADEVNPALVAQRIIDTCAAPIALEHHEVFVTLSIGIGLYPNDGESLDLLLKNADTAMYQAKAQGKNCYQFYCHSMNAHALERLTLQNSLHKALEQQHFLLHYQPKLQMASGTVPGFEALLRWRHPEIGMVSPLEFIPLAEENGLIVPITEWVIGEACRQAKRWEKEGIGAFSVAVNLSTRLFKEQTLLQMVQEALAASGLPPERLELEITETVMLHEIEQAIELLQGLQDLGVRISIDDFGTGYSSFAYLKKLPVDALKIDRSFVKDLSSSEEDLAIVEAIIATAHSLGLRVIAEGVETEEQLRLLRLRNCDEMQGFLLSRPLPPGEVPAFLARRPPLHQTEAPAAPVTLLSAGQ